MLRQQELQREARLKDIYAKQQQKAQALLAVTADIRAQVRTSFNLTPMLKKIKNILLAIKHA